MSSVGNGAIIVYVPDAPINMASNTAFTTSKIISIIWNDGPSDGGTPIIDYKITYD
jgi:hypothetical protein